ncbi:hypothetical protein GCM10009839_59290 [Catenulispora yoronensis]|uniref:Uncharacterized protein n=1 Tax=Catenulispora yoronensis TaxID=450799 RepID=A0ABP5GJ56_9ACTN
MTGQGIPALRHPDRLGRRHRGLDAGQSVNYRMRSCGTPLMAVRAWPRAGDTHAAGGQSAQAYAERGSRPVAGVTGSG